MIRLRPYKKSDAEYIMKWFTDKKAFTQWCADNFTYPLTKEQLEYYYHKYEKDENAWIISALNEEGIPVGHFLMRLADYKKESIHLGFIIVDSKIRGKGYGKEMVSLAVKYAFDILKVKRVTLGVFDNNPAAHNCYKSLGFIEEKYNENTFIYGNEKWGIYNMAIEKLILIIFEKKLDSIYKALELQYLNGDNEGKGFRVLAYRNDGYTDMFDDLSLNFNPNEKCDVVEKGLNKHVKRNVEDTVFEVTDGCVEVSFDLEDLEKRKIHVYIKEQNRKKSITMNLLAPIGHYREAPSSLPVFFLYDFDFI
ncbi:MAG: GNAT family N-acetyltransferase [Clostridiales bacterium]|nr:GNAT family N-acetyltransferase [Clostridiales bacterium]